MDARELSDRFETTDGSGPEGGGLPGELARRLPLGALSLLAEGDVFEQVRGGRPPAEGIPRAQAYLSARILVHAHGATVEQRELVRSEVIRQISGNLELINRLEAAKPIEIDLIPPGKSMVRYGYPKQVSQSASGLFWDHPSWPSARIAFRQDRLGTEAALVIHEMAHAIHFLALSNDERDRIYRLMIRTYRTRRAVDEVFAIYSEREFVEGFSDRDQRAPGVYGVARQRWSEEHLFTRFVRHLYFPYKPLAGQRA